MNQRIKELLEQVGVTYVTLPKDTVYEKFAQLIIDNATECVRDVLRDENSELTYAACDQVQQRIRQHFGVE